MPKVGCPQCGKSYQLPDSAVGKVATCKCGAKFRVRTAAPSAAVGARPAGGKQPAPAPRASKPPRKPTAKAAPATAPVSDPAPLGEPDDDFWNSEFPDAAAAPLAASTAAVQAGAAEPSKRVKKRSSGDTFAGSAAKRLAKIIGGAALVVGWCALVYMAYADGGRIRVRGIWMPIVGLGLIASGLFGE